MNGFVNVFESPYYEKVQDVDFQRAIVLRRLLRLYMKYNIYVNVQRSKLTTWDLVLICPNGHWNVVAKDEVEKYVTVDKSGKVVGIKEDVVKRERCRICGLPVKPYVYHPPDFVEPIVRKLEKSVEDLRQALIAYLEAWRHPLYMYWLKHVKGVVPLGASAILTSIEISKAPKLSKLYRFTGFHVIGVCPKCGLVMLKNYSPNIHQPEKRTYKYCPRCGAQLVGKFPSKKLYAIGFFNMFKVKYYYACTRCPTYVFTEDEVRKCPVCGAEMVKKIEALKLDYDPIYKTALLTCVKNAVARVGGKYKELYNKFKQEDPKDAHIRTAKIMLAHGWQLWNLFKFNRIEVPVTNLSKYIPPMWDVEPKRVIPEEILKRLEKEKDKKILIPL